MEEKKEPPKSTPLAEPPMTAVSTSYLGLVGYGFSFFVGPCFGAHETEESTKDHLIVETKTDKNEIPPHLK